MNSEQRNTFKNIFWANTPTSWKVEFKDSQRYISVRITNEEGEPVLKKYLIDTITKLDTDIDELTKTMIKEIRQTFINRESTNE